MAIRYGHDPQSGRDEWYSSSGHSEATGHYNPSFDEDGYEARRSQYLWGSPASYGGSYGGSGSDEAVGGLVVLVVLPLLGLLLAAVAVPFVIGATSMFDVKSGAYVNAWSQNTIVYSLPMMLLVGATILSLLRRNCSRLTLIGHLILMIAVLAFAGPAKAVFLGCLYFFPLFALKTTSELDKEFGADGRAWFLMSGFWLLFAGGVLYGCLREIPRPELLERVRLWLSLFEMPWSVASGTWKLLFFTTLFVIVALWVEDFQTLLLSFHFGGVVAASATVAFLKWVALDQPPGQLGIVPYVMEAGLHLAGEIVPWVVAVANHLCMTLVIVYMIYVAQLRPWKEGFGMGLAVLRQNKMVFFGLVLVVCREVADFFGLLALL